jgi:hypothetical protein
MVRLDIRGKSGDKYVDTRKQIVILQDGQRNILYLFQLIETWMAPRIYLKWSWYYSGKFRFEREDALRADSADSTTK